MSTLKASLALSPDKKLAVVALSGTAFSSPHHNAAFLRGNTPLTSRPLQAGADPIPRRQRSPALPWYPTAPRVSQPLDLDDYGGTPVKIIGGAPDIALAK